jgi:hypothetical protein
MLAALEDGFAQMYSLQTIKTEEKNEEKSTVSGIGLSNIFSLFSVEFKGTSGKKDNDSTSSNRSEDKIHTPTSLFTKLLDKLEDLDAIIDIHSLDNGNKNFEDKFVRFSGRLSQNPITAWLEAFSKIMEIMNIFQRENKPYEKIKNSKKLNPDPTIQQIQSLLTTLKSSDPYDILCKIENSDSSSAVMQVSNRFFTNNNTNEIIDGNFTIIGKIVKFANNDDPINLLRNTNLSFLKVDMIEKISKFSETNDITNSGVELPKLNIIVSGNAILVIPIAIYT